METTVIQWFFFEQVSFKRIRVRAIGYFQNFVVKNAQHLNCSESTWNSWNQFGLHSSNCGTFAIDHFTCTIEMHECYPSIWRVDGVKFPLFLSVYFNLIDISIKTVFLNVLCVFPPFRALPTGVATVCAIYPLTIKKKPTILLSLLAFI